MRPSSPCFFSSLERRWASALQNNQRVQPKLSWEGYLPPGGALTAEPLLERFLSKPRRNGIAGPWRHAALLIGPTGSGKTTYGLHVEQQGFCGRQTHHFDFGEQLRSVVDPLRSSPELSAEQVEKVRSVLGAGALLEDSDADIIRMTMRHFVQQQDCSASGVLLLNGMPRHAGQASLVASLVDVRWVIHLCCDAETVHARIAADSGGDRDGRVDDSTELIAKKLVTFHKRTQVILASCSCLDRQGLTTRSLAYGLI